MPASDRTSLSLGVERIGLLALRAPVAALGVIAMIAAISLFGVSQLRTDDALKDLLRSDTQEYRTYERLQRLFPTNELDVFAVVDLGGPLSEEKLAALRDIHFDIGLTDGVGGVISMFSIHRRGQDDKRAVPVIPDELPVGEAFKQLVKRLGADDLIAGRLFAKRENGDALALMVIALKQEAVDANGIETVVAAVGGEAGRLARSSGLRIAMTGAPVMKTEILAASRRDSRFFNIAGFTIGLLICLMFFQQWRYVVIVIVPTALAVICALGLIGFGGVRLNPLMNTIIPLVMVISFANALHLVFAVRRGLDDGRPPEVAIANATSTVGPACVLSATTTAIAFASLALTDSQLVSTFGLAAAVATAASLLLVTAAVACLSALLVPGAGRATSVSFLPRFSDGLDAGCGWLAEKLVRSYYGVGIVAGLVIVGCTIAYLQLEPRYRFTDIIPEGNQAADVAETIDRHFGGINTVHILITAKAPLDDQAAKMFAAVGDADAVLGRHPKLHNTRSIAEIRRVLGGEQAAPPAKLLRALPEPLAQRYFSADKRATLITASAGNLEAQAFQQMRADLAPALVQLRARYPEFDFTVTGLATVSTSRAVHTITSLNRALIIAMVVVLAVVGVLFRSIEVALLSLCANVFAVVAAGSGLYAFDIGLQYVSVVGLTVAFGLAVDDTIHFLNRYWLERNRGLATLPAVRVAIERVGSILVLTTVVIVCGLATTLTSNVPPTRTFGALCMATLVFALIGDVIILPAAILIFRRLRSLMGQSGLDN